MNGVSTRLSPICLVNGCCMSINISGEDTFMAQSVERGVESADATKQVNESHRNNH